MTTITPVTAFRRSAPVLLATLLTAPLGACALGGVGDARARESHNLSIPDAVEIIHVTNDVGDVTIRSDDNATAVTAEVVVTGKAHTEEQALEALGRIDWSFEVDSGNTARADVSIPKGYFNRAGRGYSVDWLITSPPNVFVKVRNDVGDVSITRFTGGADVRVDVGDVDIEHVEGAVKAVSDVGDVRIGRALGGLFARSDVGDITAAADGNIEVVSEVGSVSLRVLPGATGEVVARSDIGSVSLELPAGASAMIDAETDIGDVTVTLEDGAPVRVLKNKSGKYRAQLGAAGGPSCTLRSDIGGITIRTGDAG